MGTIQGEENLDASLHRRRQDMGILGVDDLPHLGDLLRGWGVNEVQVEIGDFLIEPEQRVPPEFGPDVPFGLQEDKTAA